MNWQRARTDENKNERKEAIYKAAFALFKKNGFDKVSFNGIASEAGFTKSNMYRYFSSKEEIFLNIFADLFEQWVEDCISRLQQLKQDEEAHIFAETYVASLMSHQEFLDLTPLLFISLERNSSYEQLLVFKRQSKNLLFSIVMEISRVYPDIQDERAFKLLTLCHAATTSYWSARYQNEALKKIYQQDEFKEMTPNFEHDLTGAIEVIVHGLKASK